MNRAKFLQNSIKSHEEKAKSALNSSLLLGMLASISAGIAIKVGIDGDSTRAGLSGIMTVTLGLGSVQTLNFYNKESATAETYRMASLSPGMIDETLALLEAQKQASVPEQALQPPSMSEQA